MSRRARTRGPSRPGTFALLASATLLACVLFGYPGRGAAPAPGAVATMQALSASFDALAAAARARDATGVRAATRDLRRAALGLRQLAAPPGALAQPPFVESAARAGELLARIDELAADGRPGDAEPAISELRAACVSCHVRFRADGDGRKPFGGPRPDERR